MSQIPYIDSMIGLMGKKGSGKDTVADYLVQEYGFIKMAFADPLKTSLLALNPIIEMAVDGYTPIRIDDMVTKYGWDIAKQHPEVRALLQRLGTEAGRAVHGFDLWTNAAMHQVRTIADQYPQDDPLKIVVTDVRFENEAKWVKRFDNSTLWKITRNDLTSDENSSHASENLEFPPDLTITNNGTIKELHTQLKMLAELSTL